MNKKTSSQSGQAKHPESEKSNLSPEMRDMIKHPPKMDDVIREQSPAERRGNPALVPEMLEQPISEIIGNDE